MVAKHTRGASECSKISSVVGREGAEEERIYLVRDGRISSFGCSRPRQNSESEGEELINAWTVGRTVSGRTPKFSFCASVCASTKGSPSKVLDEIKRWVVILLLYKQRVLLLLVETHNARDGWTRKCSHFCDTRERVGSGKKN